MGERRTCHCRRRFNFRTFPLPPAPRRDFPKPLGPCGAIVPVVCIEAASRRPQPVKMPPPPLAVGWKCSAATKKVSSLVSTPPFYVYRKFSYHAFVCSAFLDRGRVSRVALPFPQPAPRPTPRNKMPPGPGTFPFGSRGRRQCRVGVGASFSFNLAVSHSQEAELHRTRLPRDLGRRLHRQFPAYSILYVSILHGRRKRKIN